MTARTAREGLAKGLALLQDPNLPPQFMGAAEPIARAMGLLMQVEKSDARPATVRSIAEQGLAAVRDALGRLQSINVQHPAAENALAAVAGSLALVHTLTRLPDAPAAPAAAAYAPPAAPAFSPPAATYAQPQQQYQPPPQQPQQNFGPPPQPFAQPPQQQQQNFGPPPQQQQQNFGPPPQQQQQQNFGPPPQQQQQNFGPPPQQQFGQTPFPAPPAQPNFGAPPQQFSGGSAPAARPAASPTGGDSIPPAAGTIEAELAAHSPSNFYKTLSGNDIVDHGGIFVATYSIPKMGVRVMLRIHLPGGYHFDCAGLVKWTREARDNPDAPPGFGAQFHGITAEQRQLIQRYVRNREPLFYDDL